MAGNPRRVRNLRTDLLGAVTELQDQGEGVKLEGYRVAQLLRSIGIRLVPTPQSKEEDLHPEPGKGAGEQIRVGRFALRGQLGEGGMGRVIEAHDPELRRTVAVKVMLDPSQVTEERLARFVAEAQITAQLQHPNIVPVHEIGVTEEGEIYFVMKKIGGQHLDEVIQALREGKEKTAIEWTQRRLLGAFVQVCHAVAYAHSEGVLHRDLKPENIMVGSFGEVQVMDWGVARLMGDETELVRRSSSAHLPVARTVDGATIGTPGYMSPEQATGKLDQLDATSDVFSLGCILYEILALQPAYDGEEGDDLIAQTMHGPPVDPRRRAPYLDIPLELSDICLRALSAKRYETASELAAAVEDFLEGSRRREEAAARMEQAQRLWVQYRALDLERRNLARREQTLAEATPLWSSIGEKRELLEVRLELERIEPRRDDLFGQLVAAAERALSHDPEGSEPRGFLARAYWDRMMDAEARADNAEARYCAGRIRNYDPGTYTELLDGTGELTLNTDPSDAEVLCARFSREGLVWSRVEERSLGRTPIERMPIEMGSYLLSIRASGRRDTSYPILISRGRHWDFGREPVPLYTDDEIGDDFVYVPPGPFICGGDPEAQGSLPGHEPWLPGFFIGRHPITMAEYCEFLTDVHDRDPEAAWSQAPRYEGGLVEFAAPRWERPARGQRYHVPERDADGDPVDPQLAVFPISWSNAVAYAAWRERRDGLGYGLPYELEWEKAARGVDGRYYPWGNRFDPTLCIMRDSQPGPPRPAPIRSAPHDVSVYGVRDLAGTIREWCGDLEFDGNPRLRVVRGGAWNYVDARGCRAAYRNGFEPHPFLIYGFRLVHRP